jgi:exopolysaccharide production protein ExoQ
VAQIIAKKPVMVSILALLFAGDFFRNALTIPVWAALVIIASIWSLVVIILKRVSWRALPIPLLALLAWWAVSPVWSPYPTTSLLMLISVVMGVLFGLAITSAVPLDDVVRRSALSLRLILVGSILFEVVVALIGHPVYPVGFSETSATPIEMAWSRGLFFSAGRIQGLVGNANVLGMLGLVLLITGLWHVYASRQWRSVAVLDVALAIIIIGRTMSATVTVTLGALAVVIGLAALARRNGPWWRIGLCGAVAVIGGAVVAAVVQWSTFVGLLGKSPDLTHRFDIWAAVVDRFAERPILGSGFVGWWPSWDPWFAIHSVEGLPMSQAHNVWLDIAMQSGFVGVVLFAVTLVFALWHLGRTFAQSPLSLASVPFLILCALTVQSLTESRLLHEWGFVSFITCAIIAERIRVGTIEKL